MIERAFLGIAGACAIGLAALVLVQTHRLAGAETALQTEKDGRATDRANQAKEAARAIAIYRAEEARTRAAMQEVSHVARLDAARARADAVAAAGAAVGLRQRAAELAASCGAAASDPASPAGSAPAAGAGLLLAELLGRADDRAGGLAEYADQARAAGRACEAAYDALTVR